MDLGEIPLWCPIPIGKGTFGNAGGGGGGGKGMIKVGGSGKASEVLLTNYKFGVEIGVGWSLISWDEPMEVGFG